MEPSAAPSADPPAEDAVAVPPAAPSRSSWTALVLWLVLIALLAVGAVTLWGLATRPAPPPEVPAAVRS